MLSVRVYVGGLPADAKTQELRERFGRFVSNASDCTLQDVEMPKLKPVGDIPPPAGATRGFAYLTLQGTDAETQSEKLQKTFNRTKWRGGLLKVQVARPHFQDKLAQEWTEALQKVEQHVESRRQQMQQLNTPVETLEPLNLAIKFKGKKKTTFVEGQDKTEVQVNNVQIKTDVQVNEVQVKEEVQVKQETDSEETESEEEVLDEDDVEAFVRQMEMETQADGNVVEEDDVEAFVRQMETKEEEKKQKNVLSKEEMNTRRLAALEAKQQRKKEEKVAIPVPGEKTANKKITFDDSGNEQETEEQEEEEEEDVVVSNWMESSDDEADEDARTVRRTFDFTGDEDAAADAEAQAAFALRPEFLGEKGKKLFEMQKRFGGDSRFRLDARFLEQEANEFGGNEVEEEMEKERDEEAIAELQNFLDEENPEEAARHAREMREEQEAALRVVSKLFPEVDVTQLQRRMQDQRAPKDPLKEAAWMGELKRYDPRDAHACREFEIPMTIAVSGAQTDEETPVATSKREEKEMPTGGDRFFATTGDLSNLFSRVRKNSEDGEEGEAALDGVFGSTSVETGNDAPFKMSALFSFPVGEDKPLAALGEELLEDHEFSVPEWTFSHAVEDDVMATDSEADEEESHEKVELMKKRAKKTLEDFLTFGKTFVGGEDVQDWPERRKKLTLDYKRKRRDTTKMKKRQSKQQSKAVKAKSEANTTSKWKKPRLEGINK